MAALDDQLAQRRADVPGTADEQDLHAAQYIFGRAMPYDHSTVEPKWQARWRDAGLHQTPTDPEQAQVLRARHVPLPVGRRACTSATARATRRPTSSRAGSACRASTCCTRWAGTPSACRPRTTPSSTASTRASPPRQAIANFKRQIDVGRLRLRLGRARSTPPIPAYVKWTQWIFLQLFKRGLAYEGDRRRSTGAPSCKTGLANEEVTPGALRALRHAGRAQGHAAVDAAHHRATPIACSRTSTRLDWPDVDAGDAAQLDRPQRGRRGRRSRAPRRSPASEIRVFTTRPDTLFGATYMVLAPEHPLVDELTTPAQRAAVDGVSGGGAAQERPRAHRSGQGQDRRLHRRVWRSIRSTASRSRSGSPTTCWRATAPAPSWPCPAHDERDFAFATDVRPADRSGRRAARTGAAPRAGRGLHRRRRSRVNSGPLDGLPTPEAKRDDHRAELEARGVGKRAVSYRLRDWVFSRQRYWGEPIPIVHCPTDGVGAGARGAAAGARCPTSSATSRPGPASRRWRRSTSWVEHHLPEVRRPGQARDQHHAAVGGLVLVLPALPRSEERRRAPFDPKAEKEWMPVDLYVGGAEHAVLHLLYARFWHKVLFDMGIVHDEGAVPEAAPPGDGARRTRTRTRMGRYHELAEVEQRGDEPFLQGDRRDADVDRREDGQVEAERRQPRRRHPRLRRRRDAPLRDVHGRVRAAQALGPARHRGREPLPQARLALRRGVRRGAARPPATRTCACATRPSSA